MKKKVMNLRNLINSKKCIRVFFLGALIILSLNLLINDHIKTNRKSRLIRRQITKETQKIQKSQTQSDIEEWEEIKNGFGKIISNDEEKSLRNNYCDAIPTKIKKRIKIHTIPEHFNAVNSSIDKYNFSNGLENGGKWSPKNCLARHKVAIVIPYKNRIKNLNFFLYHMHPFLQRQELEYQIFVVEQANNELFNKGILMNSAFYEIRKIYNYTNPDLYLFPFDCIIYHDVDLLPEDDRILYSCPQAKPRHLSVAIDKFKYKIFYYRLIGGVLNFRIHHFVKVNGYSNEYWGWGGEDDDMEVRLSNMHIGYERPNINIAHYSMLKHDKSAANPLRKVLLKKAKTRFQKDGLNNVNYTVKGIVKYRMFTHILIDVGQIRLDMIQNNRKTLKPIENKKNISNNSIKHKN